MKRLLCAVVLSSNAALHAADGPYYGQPPQNAAVPPVRGGRAAPVAKSPEDTVREGIRSLGQDGQDFYFRVKVAAAIGNAAIRSDKPQVVQEAIAVLKRLLSDPEAQLRAEAAMRLQFLAEKKRLEDSLLPVLAKAAKSDPDEEVRAQMVNGLTHLLLVGAMSSEVRAEGLRALSDRMLTDPSAEVRYLAAEGILDQGPVASLAVDNLRRAQSDPDARVRAFAASALMRAGQTVDADALLQDLKRESVSADPEARLKAVTAMYALAAAGRMEAVKELVRMLREDRDADVKSFAALQVGQIKAKNPLAVDELKLALATEQDDANRRYLQRALDLPVPGRR